MNYVNRLEIHLVGELPLLFECGYMGLWICDRGDKTVYMCV